VNHFLKWEPAPKPFKQKVMTALQASKLIEKNWPHFLGLVTKSYVLPKLSMGEFHKKSWAHGVKGRAHPSLGENAIS
jgi:hypothetical protein